MSFLATVFGGVAPVQKRGLVHYDYDSYDLQGQNGLDDYSHGYNYAHSLPAYSTVKFFFFFFF